MPRQATGSAIQPKKDGPWYLQIRLRDHSKHYEACPPREDGVAVDRIYAKAVAADLQRLYNGGHWEPGRPLRKTSVAVQQKVGGETVNAWTDRWLADRERRGLSSVRNDKCRLKAHILPVIGDVAVTSRDLRTRLEAFASSLDDKVRDEALSWRTAVNIWTLAQAMFRDACSIKKTRNSALVVRTDNPIIDIPGPERGSNKVKQYLYPSEFLALASCDEVPLVFRRLCAVCTFAFLRAGEAEALEWADVDLEHSVIHVHQAVHYDTRKVKATKTMETRNVPIEPELLPLLKAMHEESGGKGRLFEMSGMKKDLAENLRLYLQRAGVGRAALFANGRTRKNITFHDLRATGITWMAVRGDAAERIRRRAGHRFFGTTDLYIREAESLAHGFGSVFPPLPECLLKRSAT